MIKEGDTVKILENNLIGKVVRTGKNKNKKYCELFVENKIVKLETKLIEKIDMENIQSKKKISSITKDGSNFSILDNLDRSNEIMLRYQNVDEAIYSLEKFIEEALIYNFKEIRIIHGKKGGVLRQAVHDYLKTDKNIQSFRLGNYFEGQFGVTIAKLK